MKQRVPFLESVAPQAGAANVQGALGASSEAPAGAAKLDLHPAAAAEGKRHAASPSGADGTAALASASQPAATAELPSAASVTKTLAGEARQDGKGSAPAVFGHLVT